MVLCVCVCACVCANVCVCVRPCVVAEERFCSSNRFLLRVPVNCLQCIALRFASECHVLVSVVRLCMSVRRLDVSS